MAAGWDIEAVLYAPSTLKSDFALEMLSRFPGRIERVSGQVLESVAGKDNPQGILAIVHQRNRLLVDLGDVTFGVALVSPQDPGNLGTVLRTLDAVRADALFVLDGGVDQYHPTAIRASMGTCFWVPIVYTGFEDFDTWRRSRHFELIGTSARGGADLRDYAPARPWILVLGSEQKGLSADQKDACDVVLSLPMKGRTSSLNLAVAAGILLYGLTG
jgi:TrmH family RNA methyltransferase